MAKLGSYYSLCPLIENKSLLGISEDSEKGIVIVTLGKNIAGKYKLSDQKQLCCWKTKEKFSSSVIYDKKKSKYVAVFNQSCIKIWNSEEENLDKLKKYKFNQQIHSLLSVNEDIFVLFENGSLYTLEHALQLRKELKFEENISDGEKIDDVLHIQINHNFYIGLITKSTNNDYYLYWKKHGAVKNELNKIKLQRDIVCLRGYAFHVMENVIYFLTLWSDGRIFSYLLEDSEDVSFPGELFTVLQQISTKYEVCILSLDENYLAMFGANSNEEGAVLLIYNTQFKIVQSKQVFKLFTSGAKLWNCDNNLLLPISQNLAVIPFYLETEQLAALVGSHKAIQNEFNDVMVVQEFELANWDQKVKLQDPYIPKELKSKVDELFKQGLPESVVMEEILSISFQTHDIDSLSLYINYFSDIPEKYLAKLLKYLVTVDGKVFPDKSNHLSKLLPCNLQPISRTELIDKVLCKSFSEILLLPYLRAELTINEVVALLNYLYFLWSEESHMLPTKNVVKAYEKLIEWSLVIIDASYQKLLFSKNDCVEVALNQLNSLIDHHLSSFEDLKLLSSILNYLKTKKACSNGIGTNNVQYSVEQVCFY